MVNLLAPVENTPYVGGTANSLITVDVNGLQVTLTGIDGQLVTWSAAGVLETVAAGNANDILTSAGAGSVPAFQSSARLDTIDVGTNDIAVTSSVAGLRVRAGTSNFAILLQPLFDTVQGGQIGEAASIVWYGAAGERFATIGPHAGGHDHWSIYTKIDGAGDGDTGLEKRLDIDFGTSGDNNANVKWNAVKEFHITNDGGIPLVGIGTDTPETLCHVYAGTVAAVLKIESDGAESQLLIEGHTGFDSLLIFKEATVNRWLMQNDASLGNRFTIHDYALPGSRLTFIGNGEAVFNDTGADIDFRVEAVGEANALFVDGANGNVSLAGDRVVGTGSQSETLGVGVTTFVANKKFIILTGDGAGNTLATITGAQAFAGNEITILCVDALVTITDTDAHTADTVDLSAAFTSADDTIIKLVYDGTSWYETSRSVN